MIMHLAHSFNHKRLESAARVFVHSASFGCNYLAYPMSYMYIYSCTWVCVCVCVQHNKYFAIFTEISHNKRPMDIVGAAAVVQLSSLTLLCVCPSLCLSARPSVCHLSSVK